MSKEEADRLAMEVMRQLVVKRNILGTMGVPSQELLDELQLPEVEDAVGEGWRWSSEGRKDDDDETGEKGEGESNRGKGDDGDV